MTEVEEYLFKNVKGSICTNEGVFVPEKEAARMIKEYHQSKLKNLGDIGSIIISSNNNRREKLIDRFSLILGWGKIVMTEKQEKDLNYLIKITEEVYLGSES